MIYHENKTIIAVTRYIKEKSDSEAIEQSDLLSEIKCFGFLDTLNKSFPENHLT